MASHIGTVRMADGVEAVGITSSTMVSGCVFRSINSPQFLDALPHFPDAATDAVVWVVAQTSVRAPS